MMRSLTRAVAVSSPAEKALGNSAGTTILRTALMAREREVPRRVFEETGRLKWLYVYGTVDQGSGVNYQPAGSLAPFLGNTWDASSGITIRPAPRLRWMKFTITTA